MIISTFSHGDKKNIELRQLAGDWYLTLTLVGHGGIDFVSGDLKTLKELLKEMIAVIEQQEIQLNK